MECKSCRQLLEDYIDRELTEDIRVCIEQHLGECVECRREVEFLSALSKKAAFLPKNIEPDKDLWHGISALIQENRSDSSKTRWLWRIAAAAMIGSIAIAGGYLLLHKQIHKNSGLIASQSFANKPSKIVIPPPTNNGLGILQEKERPNFHGTSKARQISPSDASLTYSLDKYSKVFTSNYGIYAVRKEFVPDSYKVSRDYIIRFDRNGMQSWIPPLPPQSTIHSIFPGRDNQLWVCWAVQNPSFQIGITELEFGVDSRFRNLWKTSELFILGFAVTPQGLIYASGFRYDINKSIEKLSKGQSITVELLHAIDPATGSERHLLPVKFQPKYDMQLWQGQTLLEMTALATETAISVRSNGNFFVSLNRTSIPWSVGDLIANEALEYSPDGEVVRKWEVNSGGSERSLNKIFVDNDDSILMEVLTSPDSNLAKERSILRLTLDGKVTKYNPAIYPNEIICGWIGQRNELVTLMREGNMQELTIHKKSF